MATNPYFSHYTATNEQNLIDGLVIESIQQQGLDVFYIEREQVNIDKLFNEDPTNTFKDSISIEMYPASVDGFDGEGEMFTRFGLDIKKTATFVVSKTRFKQEFPLLIRPKEGDLIFMPITNAILEIKFVDLESPFFEKGKQYVYEIKTETFENSHEDFINMDPSLDDPLDMMQLDNLLDPQQAGGTNQYIEDEVGTDITYDPANPFGVR